MKRIIALLSIKKMIKNIIIYKNYKTKIKIFNFKAISN